MTKKHSEFTLRLAEIRLSILVSHSPRQLAHDGDPYCLSPTELYKSLLLTLGAMTTGSTICKSRGALLKNVPDVKRAQLGSILRESLLTFPPEELSDR